MSSPLKHVSACKKCSRDVPQPKQLGHATQHDSNMSNHTVRVVRRSPLQQDLVGTVIRNGGADEGGEPNPFPAIRHSRKNRNLVFMHTALSPGRSAIREKANECQIGILASPREQDLWQFFSACRSSQKIPTPTVWHPTLRPT